MYPSVKGQTLPGAGAEHRGRAGYGQNQNLSTADSNWFIVGCGVTFYLGSNAGRVPLPTALAQTVCVLRVFLIPSLAQYFVGNRY